QGKYFEWSNDIGGTFTNKLQGFFRSACKVKYFYPWNRSTVIASSLELGWMNAQGGLQKIPLQERFYAGGPNTLRGFGYKMTGPLDINRIPTGGSLKLVWNLIEIRRTLYKMIGGVVFADIGNVWQVPKYFKFNGLRSVFGLGIRFNTPVGLVRLDYGINVDKRVNEDSGKLYFSIGHAF
ncbi:hypothetical protein AMJ80_10265, partial [bacterium SM23_31]